MRPVVSQPVFSFDHSGSRTGEEFNGRLLASGLRCPKVAPHRRILDAARRPSYDPAMEYAKLGRSNVSVSRISSGPCTSAFAPGREESLRIMDAALGGGINFFDTADVYGGPKGYGRSEEIIGRWFAAGGRDAIA